MKTYLVNRLFTAFLIAVTAVLPARAHEPRQAWQRKMSPHIRHLAAAARQQAKELGARSGMTRAPEEDVPLLTCAFVRLDEATAAEVLSSHGARSYAQWGDLHIVTVPTDELEALAAEKSVSRIEARRSNTIDMDSTAMHVNALPAYAGTALPQAFTGKGVVMGIMDIGFDLTHPNFFSRDLSQYRIRRLWDMLYKEPDSSTLTQHDSSLPVGGEFVGSEALLAKGCSADGQKMTHGTHTLGIAAGSGYDSPYRGMAQESDICLVANATTNNVEFVDSIDEQLYTSALDALGFKYIFDYAQAEGKPCVISFSEGSQQFFDPEDVLYFAALDSMTGPGRIIVASAGNSGRQRNYLLKPKGERSAGSFVYASAQQCGLMLRSSQSYNLRMVVYGAHNDTITYCPENLFCQGSTAVNDSIGDVPEVKDTLQLHDGTYAITMAYYPSVYNERDSICEVFIEASHRVGNSTAPLSIELIDDGQADVECFAIIGALSDNNSLNPLLCRGESSHSVGSPSCAPTVISVGSTTYRQSFVNFKGETQCYNTGEDGERGDFSSTGPSLDGRIKPDVLAPGANIVSSYSSYYLEANPDARTTNSHVRLFDHNGRTYLWAADSGTSMSAPVVGGAIALWLQAKPDLTPQEAMAVLERTARHNDTSLSYPNNLWGYGEIDVYRGLLDLLGLDGIEGLSTQPSALSIRPTGHGSLLISCPEALSCRQTPLTVTIYALSGQKVFQCSKRMGQGAGDMGQGPVSEGQGTVELTIPSLPHGVYAVQAGAYGSTLIRL